MQVYINTVGTNTKHSQVADTLDERHCTSVVEHVPLDGNLATLRLRLTILLVAVTVGFLLFGAAGVRLSLHTKGSDSCCC